MVECQLPKLDVEGSNPFGRLLATFVAGFFYAISERLLLMRKFLDLQIPHKCYNIAEFDGRKTDVTE